MDNKTLAKAFTTAIQTIANKPEQLENMENYLAHHFDVWMGKYANSPEGLVSELQQFANVEI